MIRRGLLVLAAGLGLVAAPLVAAQDAPSPELAASISQESGVSFPERLGNFRRAGISMTQPRALAWSYELRDSGGLIAEADLFVYPIRGGVTEELDQLEGIIGEMNSNVQRVRELAAPRGAPRAVGRLWTCDWERQHPVLTGAYLWDRGTWRIRIRFTLPRSRGEAGVAEGVRMAEAFAAGPAAAP